MKNTKLSVYLEESEVKKLDEMTKESSYTTRNKFIRHMVNTYRKEVEKKEALQRELNDLRRYLERIKGLQKTIIEAERTLSNIL